MNDENFDQEKLIQERDVVNQEFEDEIHLWESVERTSVRHEGLLMTNYVDNLLKDCIVLLFRSNNAWKISRDTILKILKERGYIDSIVFQDLLKLNKIRDLYGHTMRLSKIDERIKPIIENMNLVSEMKDMIPEWEDNDDHSNIWNLSMYMINIVNGIFDKIVKDQKNLI